MKNWKGLLFAGFVVISMIAFCRCNNAGGNSSDNTAQGQTVVIKDYSLNGHHQYQTQHNYDFYYWVSDSAITLPASVTDAMWHSSLTEPNHRGATQLPDQTVPISSFVNAPNLQTQLSN